MKEPVVLTRHCREAELQSKGLSGKALECLLAETAEERHLSRVTYARWAAEEYYLSSANLERGEVSEDTLHLMAGAILWGDRVGIGGRDGVEGTATIRHPAFASCGKGRKQATDGDAWTAAIHRAALDCAGCFRLNRLGVLVYSRARRDAPVNEIMVDEATMPVAWVYSILREGLRRAAGIHSPAWRTGRCKISIITIGWHSGVPFDAPPESLPAWGALCNEMDADRPDQGRA